MGIDVLQFDAENVMGNGTTLEFPGFMIAMLPIVGSVIMLFMAGCADVGKRVPPGAAIVATPSGTVDAREQAAAPRPAEAVTAKDEVVAARPETRPAPLVAEPAVPRAAVAVAPPAGTPPAGTSPKAVASAEPARKKKENAVPVAPPAPPPAAKPAAQPLDIATLEKRLKETSAIGVFTKLTLKNQVDDLLGRFRAYYGGRAKTTLAQLRQPYDTLILKVLSLLQDSDPSLARAVAESREAIWGILSDPLKFKNL